MPSPRMVFFVNLFNLFTWYNAIIIFTSFRQHPLYYASVVLALCRSRVVNHG